MATDTATIRVARTTRDLLAKHARARGTSLASLLADVACEQERQSIWSAERDASRLDAESPDVGVEDRAWEAALADGVD
jgi:uncharacterized protein (DUF1778 family)